MRLNNPFSSFQSRSDLAAQRPLSGLSQVEGKTEPELSTDTIGDLLDKAVTQAGDREAFVFVQHRIRWTWRQFSNEVNLVAAGLRSMGVERGDRVGIWSPNRPEWVLTQFATARIGAVLVNINPSYQAAELEYALNKASVKVLITAEGVKASRYLDILDRLAPELQYADPDQLKLDRLPHLKSIIQMSKARHVGTYTFDQMRSMAGPAQIAHLASVSERLNCFEAINVQFTSGTTGHPKGATLSHHNVVNNARAVAAAMRLGLHDRLCVPVPLYHCFGMVLAVLACTSAAGCMVFPSESFDPAETLAAVAAERCTALHGVPTMFVSMLGLPGFENYDLSSLRTGIMAGAPCPIETMKRVISDMHMPEVTIAYGMTETSPVSFQSSTEEGLDRRVTTVGRIQPHLEAKVVDADGQVVELGVTGELLVKGYSVMRGYWDDEGKTQETVVDGWMHTGDLVTLDNDGYCNVVGRSKDMLIRGGENVYPREIEEFLYTHPAISEVQVFGVPDLRFGEEVCAWVILKSGMQLSDAAVREYCRGNIAHFKIPRYVRFVESMPMTVTGKAQKFMMREEMTKEISKMTAKDV